MRYTIDTGELYDQAVAHPAMQGENLRAALRQAGALGKIGDTVLLVQTWLPEVERIYAHVEAACTVLSAERDAPRLAKAQEEIAQEGERLGAVLTRLYELRRVLRSSIIIAPELLPERRPATSEEWPA